MKALLVGYGEIGKGVYDVFSEHHVIATYDPVQQPEKPAPQEFDLLLVAFPYFDGFVDAVRAYSNEYGIEHVMVFSTTPIGTCEQIPAVHCPVEGKHPYLAESIRKSYKWLGGVDDVCETFLERAGFFVRALPKAAHTEFLKLRSTTVYGLNIEFARYCAAICDDIYLGYERVQQWDEWYNALYADLGLARFTRPILDAPEGAKGGHCVTPNAKLLNEQYPDELVARVAEVG